MKIGEIHLPSDFQFESHWIVNVGNVQCVYDRTICYLIKFVWMIIDWELNIHICTYIKENGELHWIPICRSLVLPSSFTIYSFIWIYGSRSIRFFPLEMINDTRESWPIDNKQSRNQTNQGSFTFRLSCSSFAAYRTPHTHKKQ